MADLRAKHRTVRLVRVGVTMLYPVFFTFTMLLCVGAIIYILREPIAYFVGKLFSHSREVEQEMTDAFHEGRGEEPKE